MGNCYLLVNKTEPRANWTEAEVKCETLDGQLATTKSLQETLFVSQLLSGADEANSVALVNYFKTTRNAECL
jgi:hypothetical protein